jgi:hypothetical protein
MVGFLVIYLKELIKMEISKYINWAEIWGKEICLQTSIDCLDKDDETEIEIINVIKQFMNDKNVTLEFDECFLKEDGKLIFIFSETGGQNESDTQVWSREYCFIVNESILIIDAEYRQG